MSVIPCTGMIHPRPLYCKAPPWTQNATVPSCNLNLDWKKVSRLGEDDHSFYDICCNDQASLQHAARYTGDGLSMKLVYEQKQQELVSGCREQLHAAEQQIADIDLQLGTSQASPGIFLDS